MSSTNKQISRFETTAVYTHPDATVDIVLVHGLNGEPEKTWTAKNGVYWPTDLLPASLRDARANILVYGYNADVYSKRHGSNPSDNFIYMHAQTLVTSLTHYRKDEMSTENPIIWVAHSLGGILVKRALLYSNDLKSSQHEDYRQIYVSTYGIIFLGTPHTGSDIVPWATMIQGMSDAVIPKGLFQSESVLLRTLKKDNETLQNINNHFLDVYQRFQILMAHENHKTDLKGTKMLIVDAQSASPQLPGVAYQGIEATHSGMCKFSSKNAPGYRTVSTMLRDWVGQAPDVIKTRWRVEGDEKLARAKHEIEERMKPWIRQQQDLQDPIQDPNNSITSPPSEQRSPDRVEYPPRPLLPEPMPPETPVESPTQQSAGDRIQASREPIFVKPSVFKPNTFFKGRDNEMDELHRKLMDPHRRAKGTSSVLIQSMPGGGKTHLARQYVFAHKYEYPGGVFWIRSKSLQELEYGYWDIAKSAALKEVEGLERDGFNDTKEMVKAVQTWLSSIDNWLLVLDGLHFDYPDLKDFIPFAKNTSIIFTSTEKTPGEDYQFDNPQIMVLESLTTKEAQELLLEEMGKRQPWSADDLARSAELVQLMDRLPLMIHVAALHLKATREPLAKYLRSYRSRPKAGNLPAYRAVHEQLQHRGATAALNLMSLLAFFSQHVPVEFLVLGLRALDRTTPVKTQDAESRKSSLNNTFRILIAFALVERNENPETPSGSEHSSRSVDMASDSLDILRIHGIVQAFFVDMLADEKAAPFWLERAISVFCKAFDESDKRIREQSATGVPEDYLRLQIHGKKLLSHLERFEKRAKDVLEDCRHSLESRLDNIQARIDWLNKRKPTMDEDGEVPVVSVFERTSSVSELDSQTPPSQPSNSSFKGWHILEDDKPTIESPVIYSPHDHNPYHWHVPYASPNPDAEDEDMARTITPQPAPTEIFESIAVPEEYEPLQPTDSQHRTVRRTAERRYRDHAGAWRASPQILSDPRVSLSRETVKGYIDTASATRGPRGSVHAISADAKRLSSSSEAELTLNKIKKGSPPPTRGAEYVADKIRAASGGSSTMTRPKLMAGRPSYAESTLNESGAEDDYPITPTFSTGSTRWTSSSSFTAATIKRLKENEQPVSTDGLAPVKVSSPLSAAPLETTEPTTSPSRIAVPTPLLVDDVIYEDYAPRHASQSPSRTARSSPRSSPGQLRGPFPPPPLEIEINNSSSLRSAGGRLLPSTVRRWETYSRGVDLEQSQEDEADRLAYSLPSIRPDATSSTSHMASRPDGFSMAVHPPPWTSASSRLERHPQGYSSQPMSRDPSHQSSSSQGRVSGGALAPARGLEDSPDSQVMQRPRSRRPSVVETEPSPVLEDPFDMDTPTTSYAMYNDSARPRGRRRAGSGGAYPGLGSLRHIGGKRLIKQPRQRDTSVGPGQQRSESASGRIGARMPSPRGSPDLSGAGGAFAAVGPSSGSGEEMTRSSSGGIRLADGRIVEFGKGTPPSDGQPTPGRRGSGGGMGASGKSGPGPAAGSRSGSGDGSNVGLGIS